MRESAAEPGLKCMGEACSDPDPMGVSALQVQMKRLLSTFSKRPVKRLRILVTGNGQLQSAKKSDRPRTNPMYDVAIARSENASIIGCNRQRKVNRRPSHKVCKAGIQFNETYSNSSIARS